MRVVRCPKSWDTANGGHLKNTVMSGDFTIDSVVVPSFNGRPHWSNWATTAKKPHAGGHLYYQPSTGTWVMTGKFGGVDPKGD